MQQDTKTLIERRLRKLDRGGRTIYVAVEEGMSRFSIKAPENAMVVSPWTEDTSSFWESGTIRWEREEEDMTDIVEKLHQFADGASFPGNADVMREAAYEIARLRQFLSQVTAAYDRGQGQIKRLREQVAGLEKKPLGRIAGAADEIERLRAVGNAAFDAMCDYRDNRDDEVFQDAIDKLGMALGYSAVMT